MKEIEYCPVVTTKLVFEYILLPVVIWLIVLLIISYMPIRESYKLYGSFASGAITYLALAIAYGGEINKFHSPDYSLKFSAIFFAGSYGCWLSFVTLTNETNPYIGLLILFCATNSLLFIPNLWLAMKSQLVVANKILILLTKATNVVFLIINVSVGTYNVLF